jgi:hypothetical protein
MLENIGALFEEDFDKLLRGSTLTTRCPFLFQKNSIIQARSSNHSRGCNGSKTWARKNQQVEEVSRVNNRLHSKRKHIPKNLLT